MRAFRATLESVRVPDRRHNWNNGRYCCSVSGGLHVLLKFGISFSRCYSRPYHMCAKRLTSQGQTLLVAIGDHEMFLYSE